MQRLNIKKNKNAWKKHNNFDYYKLSKENKKTNHLIKKNPKP